MPFLSRLVAGLVLLSAVAQAAQMPSPAKPLTLVFHQVGVKANLTQAISPEQLRQRVQTLQRLGYRLVTSSQAAHAAPGEKVAVIQFDDGFESVYRNAFPVLRELGVPGSAFVIWSKVGQPGFMTLAQLSALQAAGWEIGNHTWTHAALTDLTPAGIRRELAPPDFPGVHCVSYALNRHDARVRREARALGLQCAVAGGPASLLGPPDAEALPAPAITPWDGRMLPFRASSGLDLRAPLLLAGAALPVLDGWGSPKPAAAAPLGWNPATYELLGNGSFSVVWRGGESRDTRFAFRQGHWTYNIATRRGADGINGHYNGLSIAYNLAPTPLTLALGMDSGGALVGASLGLNGYGEVWGRMNRLRGDWDWAWGATLIPADYWQVYGAQSRDRAQMGVRTALPFQQGEARPLRIGAGYRWGKVNAPYLEAEYRFGSYALGAEVDSRRNFGIRFTAVW